MNFIIIGALIVQWLVARFSRIAGAIIGFLITTGILLWGFSIYAQGGYIELFNFQLSQPIFLVVCAVWYIFDVTEFIAARKVKTNINVALDSPLIQNEQVVSFYQNTQNAWSEGKLNHLGAAFANEAKISNQEFIKKYPPTEGSALHQFFINFTPLENEFMVGLGNSQAAKDNGWFLLTNLRLIQKDGVTNTFKEVLLSNVDSYKIKGFWSKNLTFKMKSGFEVNFDKVLIFPTNKFLDAMIAYKQY
jgi:hypothetical protein